MRGARERRFGRGGVADLGVDADVGAVHEHRRRAVLGRRHRWVTAASGS